MKYLAAYALLTLSGNKNISTLVIMQLPTTSGECSAVLLLKPPTRTSTESSHCSREKMSTNSSPKDLADWAPQPLSPLVVLAQPQLPRLKKSRRSKPRNNNPRRLLRSKSQSLRMKTWEICSVDQHIICTHSPILLSLSF